MEIIRTWDLCIYSSCSFQIKVTWRFLGKKKKEKKWVCSLTFALNLISAPAAGTEQGSGGGGGGGGGRGGRGGGGGGGGPEPRKNSL